MKLVVGLGNPGKKYEQTRHNIGFMALDMFAKSKQVSFKVESKFQSEIATFIENDEKILLVKPTTYMNLSGDAVYKIAAYYQIESKDILVIVDDIHLPVGKLRLREKGSDGGHNGLKHIIKVLNDQYKRIRIGIGNDERMPLDAYVLGTFSKSDLKTLEPILNEVSIAIDMFSKQIPFVDIMTRFNTQT